MKLEKFETGFFVVVLLCLVHSVRGSVFRDSQPAEWQVERFLGVSFGV